MKEMNADPLKPKVLMSSFFYKNKVYEFSQKKLTEPEREKMKIFASENKEAKREIGQTLLALEYLEKIQEIKLDLNEAKINELIVASRRKERLVIFFIFILLLTIFVSSGYFLLVKAGLVVW